MKYLLAISLAVLTLSAASQGEEFRKVEKNKEEIIDAVKEAHIPITSYWLGEENPEKFRYVTDKLLIYNFWSPSCFECTPFVNELNQLEQKYPYIKVYHFLNPHDEEIYSKKEVYNLWRTVEKTRPIIIGTNDKLKAKIKDESIPKAFMFNSRSIIAETLDKNYLAKIEDYLELLEETGSGESGLSSKDFNHKLNTISEVTLFNNPQCIVADEIEGVLYVADTWNNRIVGIDSQGEISMVIGSGTKGFKDGSFGLTSFNHPMGLAIDPFKRILYISDTYNHAIRAVNLNEQTVKTILGNGGKATILEKRIQRTESSISYPTKIQLIEGELVIELESDNLIYKLNLEDNVALQFAGTGSRGSTDGKIEEAMLNAPISAVKAEDNLLVLERNSGNIRRVSKKKIETLFDNAKADSLWLTNPSQIIKVGESIWIVDSENHAIKSLSLTEGMTLISGGKKGKGNGKLTNASYSLPSSICVLGDNAYVLDALNSCIRVIDTASGMVSTLNISNAEQFLPFVRLSNAPRVDYAFPARVGSNLLTVKLDAPGRVIKANSLNVELRESGIGEVVNLDAGNGIISIGSEVSEASKTHGIMDLQEDNGEYTYFDVSFISTGKNDKTDLKYHQYKVFITYEVSEEDPDQKPLILKY